MLEGLGQVQELVELESERQAQVVGQAEGQDQA